MASPRSRVVCWGLLARNRSEANKWWWCQMTCLTILVFLSRDIRDISSHMPPNALVMPHTVNWLMNWYVFPSPSPGSLNPLLPCLLFQMTQRSIEILLGYWTEYLWTEVSCQACGSLVSLGFIEEREWKTQKDCISVRNEEDEFFLSFRHSAPRSALWQACSVHAYLLSHSQTFCLQVKC